VQPPDEVLATPPSYEVVHGYHKENNFPEVMTIEETSEFLLEYYGVPPNVFLTKIATNAYFAQKKNNTQEQRADRAYEMSIEQERTLGNKTALHDIFSKC
jgi:hypothetical protein